MMKQQNNKPIYYSVAAVFFVNIISKGIGFFRETLMAAYYGTSEITDTFLMSNSIVNIFFSILTAISLLYIPLLASDFDKHKKGGEEQTSQFVQLILCVGLVLGVFLLGFRSEIVRRIAWGFDEHMVMLTEYFLFFSSISFLLTSINQLLIYNLNFNNIFLRANITTIILSVFQILGIVLSHKTNYLMFLNISQALGCLLQMLILTIVILKADVKVKFTRIKFAFVKNVVMLAIPVILSSVIDDVNVMIDKMFASNLEVGIISSMNYAHMLKQLLFFIIVNSGISVIFPQIANLIAEKDIKKLSQLTQTFLWLIEIIVIPIMMGSIFYSKFIIRIVYERGAFGNQSTLITAVIFNMYILALLPLAARELFQRILYSFQDTKNTFWVNAIMSLSNIILNSVLFIPMKYKGLALSTALSAYLAIPFYLKYIQQKGIILHYKFLFREAIFLLLVSTASIVPVFWLYTRTTGSVAWTFFYILLTIIIYCILVVSFRLKLLFSLLK